MDYPGPPSPISPASQSSNPLASPSTSAWRASRPKTKHAQLEHDRRERTKYLLQTLKTQIIPANHSSHLLVNSKIEILECAIAYVAHVKTQFGAIRTHIARSSAVDVANDDGVVIGGKRVLVLPAPINTKRRIGTLPNSPTSGPLRSSVGVLKLISPSLVHCDVRHLTKKNEMRAHASVGKDVMDISSLLCG